MPGTGQQTVIADVLRELTGQVIADASGAATSDSSDGGEPHRYQISSYRLSLIIGSRLQRYCDVAKQPGS